jgi:kumamolisin
VRSNFLLSHVLISLLIVVPNFARADQSGGSIRLSGHVPHAKIAKAKHLGRMEKDAQISMAVPLTLADQSGLEVLIKRLHTPGDPLYGKYLSPAEFTERFAPSQADVQSVVDEMQARGLVVSHVHPNRMLIDVQGNVSDVESAFQIEMHKYKTADGRIVYAPNSDPIVSKNTASKIVGVAGLNNFTVRHNYLRRPRALNKSAHTFTGSGPDNGMLPKDIRAAYNIPTSYTGAGQSVALVEFDGYVASDISNYASYNGLPSPNLSKILVDGYNGVPTPYSNSDTGAYEVTLDIEMLMAVVPAASILVYEGSPQTTDAIWLDVFHRIASDGTAKQVSCSWGSAEDETDSTDFTSESSALMQMSSQGQTFFSAAGDSGAYDDPQSSALEVDDPGSQPYAISVGGTTIALNSNGSYASESSWGEENEDNQGPEGGGGGISIHWPIPSWQSLVSNSSNSASATMRNVPDISLNANPDTGYDIYADGGFATFGGTSAAAPLWAGLTAMVNERRASLGMNPIGLMNPALYLIGQSSLYGQCFNDIADKSTNLFYSAVTGYDLSTGWGSFNATNIINALTNSVLPPAPPTNLTFKVVNTVSQ